MATMETHAKIAVWRQKAVEGTLSIEEMREAILVLRGDRRGAAIASDKARKAKATTAIPSADDLLNELGDL